MGGSIEMRGSTGRSMARAAGLACAVWIGVGCAGEDGTGEGQTGSSATSDEGLVEEATFSAALGVDEEEPLVAALSSFDDALAAEEDIEAALDVDEPQEFDCSLAGLRERVIDHYDENGDDRLDRSEVQALREDFRALPLRRHRFARHHRLARLVWIYDADGSHDLDETERAELAADLETRCQNRQQALLDRYDEDEDEALSDEEWEAARADLRERAEERRQAILAEFDENGDDRLGLLERLAAFAARLEHLIERRLAILSEFDADDSGDLQPEEVRALREWLKGFVRGEHFGLENEGGGEPL